MFTASSILSTAKSIADLQNTANVTYADEVAFINEAWRELYSRYTESEGDYWVKEYDVTVTSAMGTATGLGTEYLVPLPPDFYKIRTLSYNTGSRWYPVDRFAISARDMQPGVPYYRLQGSNIWLIAPNGNLPQLKMYYYTPPQTITVAGDSQAFGTTLAVSNLQNVVQPFYIADQMILYAYTGNTLYLENLYTRAVTLMYTHTNPIDNVAYYGGYIYFRDKTTLSIYRSATDLVTPFAGPTQIVTGTVLNFNVLTTNKIYYATASLTFSANLDGTSPIQILAATSMEYQFVNTLPVYINGSGFIVLNGVASTVAAQSITVYQGYVFAFNNGQLDRYTYNTTTFALVVDQLAVYVGALGTLGSNSNSSYLPLVDLTLRYINAISLVPDYQFSYPSNEVNEIMQYMCAYSFVRKVSDQVKMDSIASSLAALWIRFYSVNKRDEYQVNRINNYYQSSQGYWY